MTSTVGAGRPSARDQALNLIDFLAAYEAQRHPPVRRVADHAMFALVSSGLPEHPAVQVTPDESCWLAVDFVDLPPAPDAPSDVTEHLVDGDTISALTEPVVITPPAPAEGATAELVDELPTPDQQEWERTVAPAHTWIQEVWRPWAVATALAQAVKHLHRSLFEQRERLALDRESVELIWGFGRLRWTDAEQEPPVVVDHPVLTVPVEIGLDHRTQRITVAPAGAVDVESRMLLGLAPFDRSGYTAVRQGVLDQPIDPWDPSERDPLLQRLVRAVDDHGLLAEGAPSGSAVVDTSWTVFLRRRLPESEGFLLAMRELYREDDSVIPPPLRAILTTEDPTAATADGTAARPITEGLLLLPLPANEQQQQILRLARSHPGVVVQGPPGTGKSHTIANLISHFVADGKRVLVVAEKEQALAVLADKVPEEIRDLTVSVLGADEDGRRRLGGSIRQIQSRVGQVDPVVADARIRQLEGGIDDLDRRAALLTTQLRETRRAEITELPGDWLAGGALTPQAAAQWVSAHERFGTVPDPLTPATPAPLTTAEFVELAELVRTVGADAAREAGRALPDRSRLPSGPDFRRMIDEHVQLGAQADRGRTALRRDGIRGADLPQLTELAGALNTEAEWRRTVDGGWRARLLAQHTDPRLVDEWSSAAGTLAALRDHAFTLRAGLRAHAVRLPETAPPDLERDLQDAVTRLRGSGKIGLFARDARRALEACTVDGRPPATAEGAQLCLDALSLEVLRHQMATLWMNQAGPLGAEPLAGYPEESLGARLDQIRECRDAHERWDELRHRLTTVGLPAPTDPTADALDDAAHLTRAVAALARQRATSSSPPSRANSGPVRPPRQRPRSGSGSPMPQCIGMCAGGRSPSTISPVSNGLPFPQPG